MTRKNGTKRSQDGKKRLLKTINHLILAVFTCSLLFQSFMSLNSYFIANAKESASSEPEVSQVQSQEAIDVAPPVEVIPEVLTPPLVVPEPVIEESSSVIVEESSVTESSSTESSSESQSELSSVEESSSVEKVDKLISVSAVTHTNIKVTVSGMQSAFSSADGTITLSVSAIKPVYESALSTLDQVLPSEEVAAREVQLFELSLYQNGNPIQPLQPVQVTFSNVLSGKVYNQVKIHRLDNGASEIGSHLVSVSGSSIIVPLNHFSLYSITTLSDPPPPAPVPEVTPPKVVVTETENSSLVVESESNSDETSSIVEEESSVAETSSETSVSESEINSDLSDETDSSDETSSDETSSDEDETVDEKITLSAVTDTNITVTVTGLKSAFSEAEGEITLKASEITPVDEGTLASLDPLLPTEEEAAREINLFEIGLYQNDELIQPLQPVEVTFGNVLSNKTFNEVKVHRLDEAVSEVAPVNVSVSESDVSFMVDYFTLYGITTLSEPELSRDAISIQALGDVSATNYFPATGTSGNKHYAFKGVYIDTSGFVHVIIYNYKTAGQDGFMLPSLNGVNAASLDWANLGTTANIIVDSTTILLGGTGVEQILDFNFGKTAADLNLKETNTLTILNSAGGFSITGASLGINISHSITKTVNQAQATIGDEVIYTVTVNNTGVFTLSGINVTDTVPAGLTVLGISTDGSTYNPVTVTNSQIVLKSNLSLAKGASQSYYVKAFVNDTASNGQVITNTASTGGSVPPKTATATVTVATTDATVVKIITGNFGDLTATFPFTVAVSKNDHYSPEPITFDLGHNQSYTLTNLPTDGVLTLEEVSGDYTTTVTVDGQNIAASEGKYTINLASIVNKTITVTNDQTVVIDTAISLDSMPYLIIMMFSLISLAGMTIRMHQLKQD